ncbi:MAG: oligosaccharide biosynthesis protein Alg14 [Muribaculaceae bacterium]|nr:oligosaccharide biosynthesis protein Alg14 [Muribaculaceae bacterium]MDE5971145.1 oligosaccharide biosynthesis protein Alg14 [Muribaculaceae bacterium]MDE6462459.1 oligosaccharide biosynthesis protein Alg14 [Muribaculaceae bacterium]MDE6509175.1 oligosaccharide biosynthesis protein Alg14 [Muribaculaceae bacterium]
MKRQNDSRRPIMAVASLGGHWMQLLRLCGELEEISPVCYVSTNVGAAAMLQPGATLDVVADFSRNELWRLPAVVWRMWRIIRRRRPSAIVTTGAAPGLIAVAVGRMCGCRTLWIDSIANAATLSGSGKVAKYLAHKTFTQWPALAGDGVEYHGNTFGMEAGRR